MELVKIIKTINNILKLKIIKVKFKGYDDITIDSYKSMYNHFTKRHRLKVIQNKSIGIALIDIKLYKDFDEYYSAINGKNSAAYYSRKCLKREYTFCEINRNDYIDDIYEINTSSKERQGREMSKDYLTKVEQYDDLPNFKYFGIKDSNGKLVSYCNIGFYGEFVSINTLLGHNKFLNDGIMYLMMVELFKLIFNDYSEKGYNYIMYDTFFGATEGLKKFKNKLKFIPYKVKWIWE
jgi:hypothetical protein